MAMTQTISSQGLTFMDRITVDPKIHFGKPCIEGTRITVQSILELLNENLSFHDIIQDYYPDLQIEDIRACLKYAITDIETFSLRYSCYT